MPTTTTTRTTALCDLATYDVGPEWGNPDGGQVEAAVDQAHELLSAVHGPLLDLINTHDLIESDPQRVLRVFQAMNKAMQELALHGPLLYFDKEEVVE